VPSLADFVVGLVDCSLKYFLRNTGLADVLVGLGDNLLKLGLRLTPRGLGRLDSSIQRDDVELLVVSQRMADDRLHRGAFRGRQVSDVMEKLVHAGIIPRLAGQ
jgi:hypothetical protein